MFAGGYSTERILTEYPELTLDDISEALNYAVKVIDDEKVIINDNRSFMRQKIILISISAFIIILSLLLIYGSLFLSAKTLYAFGLDSVILEFICFIINTVFFISLIFIKIKSIWLWIIKIIHILLALFPVAMLVFVIIIAHEAVKHGF